MTDKTTHAQIVEVAVGLLSEGGLHALAMRRIATELGIQQSALYWHFENKQQLLGAVADHVVTEVEAPRRGEPRRRVEGFVRKLRSDLLRYPDGAELVATAFAFRLGGRDAFQRLAGELEAHGLQRRYADVAASVLWHFVLGFVTDEQQHRQAAELGAIEPSGDAAERSADARFADAIELILDGIAGLR